MFGDVYGHYVTQITGNILFHSVPYLTRYDPGSLEYWEFDKLGTSASMGCVRLQIKDCKWIYENCSSGTIVEFYSDSNPGPLGKPSAPKISSNGDCRNWDPTDPDSSNPWNKKTIDEENKKQEEVVIQNKTETKTNINTDNDKTNDLTNSKIQSNNETDTNIENTEDTTNSENIENKNPTNESITNDTQNVV